MELINLNQVPDYLLGESIVGPEWEVHISKTVWDMCCSWSCTRHPGRYGEVRSGEELERKRNLLYAAMNVYHKTDAWPTGEFVHECAPNVPLTGSWWQRFIQSWKEIKLTLLVHCSSANGALQRPLGTRIVGRSPWPSKQPPHGHFWIVRADQREDLMNHIERMRSAA